MVTPVETEIPGVVLLDSPVFRDARGHFRELWTRDAYTRAGLPAAFAQDNVTASARGVLRGLHYQNPSAQGKLVTVLQGEIYDVGVDLRAGSPTFGRWVGAWLRADEGRQIYIPEGFAHGFVVASESAIVHYKCTARYDPKAERSVRWDDPDLAIAWPVDVPVLSPRDLAAPRLRDVPPDHLPAFTGP